MRALISQSDRGGKRMRALIPFLLFFISFGVYLKTLCPTLYVGDSGELIAAAYTLGIAHPPGFPLWCLLAKPFTFIPINNIAWRVNLSSAFFASCAVVLVYLIMKKTSGFIIPAIATALLVAFSRCFWSIAVAAEVYSLLILLILLTIFLLLLWQEKEENKSRTFLRGTKSFSGGRDEKVRDKYLYGACLIYGLSLTVHLALLYLAPVFILWVLLVNWKMIRKVKQLSIMLLFCLLGLSIYLYLPLRSLANPPIDWGDPQTWERFLAHITRRQYIKSKTPILPGPLYYGLLLSKSTIQTSLNSIGTYFKMWSKEIPVYISWLGLIGAVRLFKNNRHWFVITLIIFLSFGLAFAVADKLRDAPDTFPIRLIPSFIVLTLWIGYGIEYLWLKGKEYSERLGGNPRSYRFLSTFLILILPISPLLNNYFFNDLSRHYLAYDYGMNILSTLDKNAILFVESDTETFALAYLTLVENKRPDITIYHRNGSLFQDIYGFSQLKRTELTPKKKNIRRTIIEKRIISAESRPIYYTVRRSMKEIPGYGLKHVGLLYQVQKEGLPQAEQRDYWSEYNLRGVDDKKIFKNYDTRNIIDRYYTHLKKHSKKG